MTGGAQPDDRAAVLDRLFDVRDLGAVVTGAASGIGLAIAEVQGLALFLASPASSYVTGATFTVDGGATAMRPLPAVPAGGAPTG